MARTPSPVSSERLSGAAKSIVLATTVDMSNLFYDGIVQALADDNWQVHLVSSGDSVARRLFGDSVQVHDVRMERGISPLRDAAALIQWIRLIRTISPDVIVVGTPKASLLGSIVGRVLRVPHVIYIVHGLRSEGTSGVLSKIVGLSEWLTLTTAHVVLAVSPSLARAVEHSYSRVKKRVEVLGFGSLNGVDVTRFAPPSDEMRDESRRNLGIGRNQLILGFSGRFRRDKGGEFLLDLIESQQMRELGAHLLVVGEIEDETLRKRIVTAQKRGLVTVTGMLDSPEFAMASIDILVHPTWREGLGMVILEAQAMSIPVIASKVTGTVDALEHDRGGFFESLNALDDWTNRIVWLSRHPDLRTNVGSQGREYVLERFEQNEVVTRFHRFVSDTVAKTSNTSEEQRFTGG